MRHGSTGISARAPGALRWYVGAQVRELRFLERWWPPRYFLAAPDRSRLSSYKTAFSELHGNPLRAWFRVFDPEQLGGPEHFP